LSSGHFWPALQDSPATSEEANEMKETETIVCHFIETKKRVSITVASDRKKRKEKERKKEQEENYESIYKQS
jgi:hypothetical protein